MIKEYFMSKSTVAVVRYEKPLNPLKKRWTFAMV